MQDYAVSEKKRTIPAPEQLTTGQMIERAEALIPMLRSQQQDADRDGQYSSEVHEALKDAGLYRILQPRRFGGYQAGPRTFLEVVNRIARGHSGSAWCFALASSHSLLLASHWPEQVQEDFFGEDGHFLAPHRVPPAGSFERVNGGYMVNGTWSYSSGSPYCTHWFGGAVIVDDQGKRKGIQIALPRDKIEILDDWGGDRTLGMNASGSNSVRLTNVFVPDDWIIDDEVLFGTSLDYEAGTIGTQLHNDPVYLGVFGGIFHLCFAAIMTGTARAALEQFEQDISTRIAFGRPGVKMADDSETHRMLGNVVADIESAEAIFDAAITATTAPFEAWARTGRPFEPNDTMRVWAMGRRAAKLAVEAVEKMFYYGGVANASKGLAMQRYFRDAQMYHVHSSSHPWVDEARGRTHLGMQPGRILGRYE